MWFSRLWIVILAAAASLTFGVALVAPKPAARELGHAHAYKLDLVQHNAHLLLKLKARGMIDMVTDLTQDVYLREILHEAGAKHKEITQLQAKANSVMLPLLDRFDQQHRPDLFILVDYQGKQIARIGEGDNKFKPGRDGLAGYPLVEAALRGFLRDDTWSFNGKLFSMAAAPVIARSGGAYAGALIIGKEIDKEYVSRLKDQLVDPQVSFLASCELAFFLRGKKIASTLELKALDQLPLLYNKKRDQLRKAGRSAALRLGQGEEAKIVVMAPLRGEAADHNAFYAVIGPTVAGASLLATVNKLKSGDMSGVGWLLVGGTFLALAILGLVLLYIERDGPFGRLYDAVRRLARQDISRLDEKQHAGKLRDVAHMVNEIVDRSGKRQAAAPAANRDIGAILGQPGDQTRPEMRVEPALGGAMPPLADSDNVSQLPPLELGGTIDLAAQEQGDAQRPQPGSIDELPQPAAGVMPLSGLGLDAPTEQQPAAPPAPAAPEEPPAPAAPAAAAEDNLPTLSPVSLPSEEKSAAPSAKAADSFSYEPLPIPGAEGASTDEGLETAVHIPESEKAPFMASIEGAAAAEHDGGKPGPAAESPPSPAGEQQDVEAYFKRIYDEFLTIKRSCGESTDNITFERFGAKLRKNRSDLMARYECTDVRFRVYIKDGKAALKATPVTD